MRCWGSDGGPSSPRNPLKTSLNQPINTITAHHHRPSLSPLCQVRCSPTSSPKNPESSDDESIVAESSFHIDTSLITLDQFWPPAFSIVLVPSFISDTFFMTI